MLSDLGRWLPSFAWKSDSPFWNLFSCFNNGIYQNTNSLLYMHFDPRPLFLGIEISHNINFWFLGDDYSTWIQQVCVERLYEIHFVWKTRTQCKFVFSVEPNINFHKYQIKNISFILNMYAFAKVKKWIEKNKTQINVIQVRRINWADIYI